MYTGTGPGLTPAIRAGKGWRGRRELASRCSATQLAARRHDPGQTRRVFNYPYHQHHQQQPTTTTHNNTQQPTTTHNNTQQNTTTHNSTPQHTATRHTEHTTQHTTHNTQHTTHNTQHTTHNTQHHTTTPHHKPPFPLTHMTHMTHMTHTYILHLLLFPIFRTCDFYFNVKHKRQEPWSRWSPCSVLEAILPPTGNHLSRSLERAYVWTGTHRTCESVLRFQEMDCGTESGGRKHNRQITGSRARKRSSQSAGPDAFKGFR